REDPLTPPNLVRAQVPVPHRVVRRLCQSAEPLLAFPQSCFGKLLLEYCRRLVRAHGEEKTVFFAGKARLLRARDQYPVLEIGPDADDDQTLRTTPCGVQDGGRRVGTATIQPGCERSAHVPGLAGCGRSPRGA